MIDHDHFVQVGFKQFMNLVSRHTSPEKEDEIEQQILSEIEAFRRSGTFLTKMKIHIKRGKKRRQDQVVPGVMVKLSTPKCRNRIMSREFFIRLVDDLCYAVEGNHQTFRFPVASMN